MTQTPEERAALRAEADHVIKDVHTCQLCIGCGEDLAEGNDHVFVRCMRCGGSGSFDERQPLAKAVLRLLDALDAADADKIRLAADGSHAISERDAARKNAAYWQDRATTAEAEVARLQAGGCARDQRTTQHCAEDVGLAAENKRMKEEVAAYECWMRDVIKTDACWPDGPQCVPTLTQELYDRFLDIRPDGKTFQPDHATLLAEVATLKAQREALLKAAKAYEKFEGALVTSNEAWQDGAAPFPTFTQELYDEWIAIQTIRNAAIALAEGEAKP